MTWLIYKHTNKINGKVYIGQTKQAISNRWKNGLGYTDRDSVFAKAIRKYKWSSFKHEIIEKDIESQEVANEREMYWIRFFKSYVGFENSNGYNMTLGGDSGEHLGYPVYQIDKKTLNIINEFPSTAEASRQFGKGESNASQIRDCCIGKKPSAKGYYWCYVKQYTTNWKPKENELISPVYQIDEELEVIRLFDSITEAIGEGYSGGTIVQCCKRKCAKANGYYWCYKNDYSIHWTPPVLSFLRNAKIYCFETDTIYSNANEAHQKTGANKSKILRCCNGLERGTNGLHFCFPKDKNKYVLQKTIKRGDIYSKQEINLLKEKYPLLGMDICKYLPNRTYYSIKKTASSLGIRYIGENKNNKKVICVELNKVFNSIKEASMFIGLKNSSSIGRCCVGQRKTAGGYHWKYV